MLTIEGNGLVHVQAQPIADSVAKRETNADIRMDLPKAADDRHDIEPADHDRQ